MKILFITSLFLAIIPVSTYMPDYLYVEYNDGTDKGRICLNTDGSGYLTTRLVDCSIKNYWLRLTYKSRKLFTGNYLCISSASAATGAIRLGTDPSQCFLFDLEDGKMKRNGTDLCLKATNTTTPGHVELVPCSLVVHETWLFNGSGPAAWTNTKTVASPVRGKYLYNYMSWYRLKLAEVPKSEFYLHENQEIWDSTGTICVTKPGNKNWPNTLHELENMRLGYRNKECNGAKFSYRYDVQSYELMYTGYCMWKGGKNNVILRRCSSLPRADISTTPVITTISSPNRPISTGAIASTPTSALAVTPIVKSMTSRSTEILASTEAPFTTPKSAEILPTYTTPCTTIAMASSPKENISTTATTTVMPTSAGNPLPADWHGLLLADPGQQCEQFCEQRGLFCSKTIETGESSSAFLSSGVTCNESGSQMKWEKPYDPAYYPADSTCAGYKEVNFTVDCVVKGFDDTRVRRLCKCLITVDEENFSSWLPWSPCTVSCGGGTQVRTRICEAEICTGGSIEEQDCNTYSCPIDGGFSDWNWTSCSASCGGGTRQKHRECNNPLPQHKGLDCYGPRRMTEKCNLQFCPINGGWTNWSEWSACDKPCNSGMYRRWRFCTNPPPLYGGFDCYGNSTEAIPCNTNICPAENIAVVGVRFDRAWIDGMKTRGSPNFTSFYNVLGKNTRTLFEYSVVNSTFKYISIEKLRQGSVVTSFTLYFTCLDSFQILLLQDAIEVDKHLGKLRIIGSNSTYNTTIVPASPPLDFTLTASKTSIKASWKEVPHHLQNGNVSGYILFYREKMLMAEPYQSLATKHLNTTVHGLNVFTEYVFRVLSYNEHGNGLASEEVTIHTFESTPSQPPLNLSAYATSGFSIIVEWQNIPQSFWNGDPVGTVVSYTNSSGISFNTTAVFLDTYAVISDLDPLTTYVIDVCHSTMAGMGPCQRTQCQTLASAPTRAPDNLTIESFIGHKILNITWQHVPFIYIFGDLKGYKITYRLVRIGGAPVVAAPKTKVLHPSITSVTLKNLQPNSQYAVLILAFNEIGDGVESATVFGETCSCPAIIYTNYAASAPYIYRDKHGRMRGLLADVLAKIISYTCKGCKNQKSTLDFVSNGKNGWAEKKSIREMKKDIDDYVQLSFPVFGSSELDFYNGYAFVPVFPHPGMVYFIIKDTLAKTVGGMIITVLKTWPIFLINVLFITLSGFFIWALDSRSNPEEFPRSCLPGVCNGIYWAFITMGTHGYGDLTPRSMLARIFAVIWIMIGLVNFAIFTGALTSALSTAAVYSDPKIYGVEVAAIHDTVAYKAAVFRNAKVNTKARYNSIEEVAAALKRREVRGALVDVFSAATRSDLFNHSDITAKRLFKYPSAFGFVLSGDMKNAASKFRDYLAVNANKIHKTIRSRTSGLEVNIETGKTIAMFSPESEFVKKTILITGIVLVISALIGFTYYYGKKYKNRHKTEPVQNQTLQEIERLCDEQLSKLTEVFEKKIENKILQQVEERKRFLLASWKQNGHTTWWGNLLMAKEIENRRREMISEHPQSMQNREGQPKSQAAWTSDKETPGTCKKHLFDRFSRKMSMT